MQSQHQSPLDRHEHKYEIERIHTFERSVALLAQPLYVALYRIEMELRVMLFALLVLFVYVALVSDERGFGIHYYISAARKVYYNIGAESAVVAVLKAHFTLILLTLAKTGCFKDPLEHHLPPDTLPLALAFKGSCQVYRILPDLSVQLLERLDLV